MKINVEEDYESLSRAAADYVMQLTGYGNQTILPATGNTPLGLYRELAAMRRRGELDWRSHHFFQLDDYAGVADDDPRSLFAWLERALLRPLEVPPANVVRLDGHAQDLDVVCRAYDKAVAEAGGIGLAILGLGLNGHLGFNEPPSASDAPTRVVALSPESLASSGHYWSEDLPVPRLGVTVGMSTILGARHIVLLVSGAQKRAILNEVLTRLPTPDVPGTFLQRHPRVEVFADRAAVGGR